MQLNEMQTLMLWALLARGGEAFAKDIKPKIRKKDRALLVNLGFVGARTVKQGLKLEVTDKGWAWAADHLEAPLPVRSTAGASILHAWLGRLDVYLRAKRIALAEVLSPDVQPTLERGGDAPPLRDRIRDTYLEVTGGHFNQRALLRDLRVKLPDVDRPSLDEALLQMQSEDGASLMQLDNRIDITDADRDAAIHIGNEPRHILWLSR